MNRRKALQKTGWFSGAALLAPLWLGLLESCKSEPRLDWQPLFFTELEARTIAALLDMILPATDTPGALDVKADMFIDKVLAKTYDAAGKADFRERLAAFNASCETTYGKKFIDLSEQDKIAVLKREESNSPKFNRGVWGKTIGEQLPVGFYRGLKSMAVWAYCTSEEIGENVLSYDPVPGIYEPCKPIDEVGNRWSL
ncbi:MAG: gluconate 2-dehydrogenase subunit 3 family protein [Bacteroidota bacterium]